MRCYFVLMMILSAVLCGMTGCKKRPEHTVRITIDFPKAAGDTIVVQRTNMISLGEIELGKVRLDSTGKGVIEVSIKEPVFAHFYSKNIGAAFLLTPGEAFQIQAAETGSPVPLRFKGDGAMANNVFYEAQHLPVTFNKWNGVYAFQLEAGEFLHAKDSLQRSYDQLWGRLKDNPEVSGDQLDLLKRYADMHVLFYQFNFAAGKDSTEIPESVRKVVQKFPADTIALKAGIFNYGFIASFFYQEEINNAIYEENEEMDADSLEALFPVLAERKIKAYQYPKSIEDFLRVKSAHTQIGFSGLTPGLYKLANTLKSEKLDDDYTNVLIEDVARWEKLSPGKSAPDFSGITPDGKLLALSDLRGKVVYVDIWATWCGPCVAAFLDSKKLQAEFKDDDRVAFLYVSVDSDTLAWKKMAGTGKVPAELHMLNGADQPASVWNRYHVLAIPHYLLIDDRGRMLAAHAPHPSTGNIREQLRKALAISNSALK